MKLKRFGRALIVVGLLASMASASSIGVYEGFEDDTLGEHPTGNYGFSAFDEPDKISVSSNGLGGTDQSLFSTTNGQGTGYVFSFSPAGQPDEIEFWLQCDTSSGISGTEFRIRGSGSGGDIFNWRCHDLDVLSISTLGNDQNSGTVAGAMTTAKNFRVVPDWNAQEYTTFVNDVETFTSPMADPATTFSSFRVHNTGGCASSGGGCDLGRSWLDELVVDGGPDSLVPDVPAGLRGEVIKGGGPSSTGFVDLAWLLSEDDPDQDVGSFDYQVLLDGVVIDTDTVDEDDFDGVRSYRYFFTGSSSFGVANFTVNAVSGIFESDESCEINLDLDDVGDQDSCGLTVPIPSLGGSEFDVGLEGTIAEFGFVSAESQMLFSMILVGMITVATGAGTKLLGSGKWKNWILLSTGILIGVMAVIIGFLDLWVMIVATMLGVFAVRGGGEAKNTFFEIRERLRRERANEHPTEMEVVQMPAEGSQPSPEAVEAVQESVDALDAQRASEPRFEGVGAVQGEREAGAAGSSEDAA